MKADRKQSHRYGMRAEYGAALYLACKGYRILARRCRNRLGEIDLIAARGATLIAVEVKARRELRQCHDSIPPWKQEKIARAMQAWLSSQAARKIAGLGEGGARNIRFDVVWIAPWRWPVHIQDAWRIE